MTDKKKVGYPMGKPWSAERMRQFYESGQYEEYSTRMRALGKSKTEEQIEKMREAKLGIPKSLEHRAAMSAAHKARFAKFKDIQEEFPNLSKTEIWKLVKEMV